MDEVTIPRENEIGITYVEGKIEDVHYEVIIEKLLKINEQEVVGIDDRGDTRFLFEVSTKERYEQIIKDFTGRDITIERGFIIKVDDISSYYTQVKISRVPFKVNNEMLGKSLETYGEVEKVKNYYKAFGKYKVKLIKSGYRIAQIRLKKPIPQSLLIKQTQTVIYIKYNNQPFACNKCGWEGHRERDCTTRKEHFKNIINVESFEEKKFNCTECDYESKSESEFKDHMNTHIEENNFECKECDYKSISEQELERHMKTHNEDNNFECEECDYKSTSQQELEAHMISHNGENSLKCNICDFITEDDKKMKEHENNQHVNEIMHEGKIIFSCDKCKFLCNKKEDLLTHLESHDTFACTKCEFVSTTKSKLKTHLKKHYDGETGPTFAEVIKSPSKNDTSTTPRNNKRNLQSPEEIKSKKSQRIINKTQ